MVKLDEALEHEFMSWLRMNQHMAKARNATKAKLKYACIEDFVLTHGKLFLAKPRPDFVKQGVMKECFKNAFDLCAATDWTYCEGYAMGEFFPMLHGWAVDNEGFAIDPTWKDGRMYFGVVLPHWYVVRTIVKRKPYGVLDAWELHYPLLSGEDDYEKIIRVESGKDYFKRIGVATYRGSQ